MAGNCISGGAYVKAAREQADAIKNQATVEAALNIALALWQRNSSKSIASMQEAIAKRNVRLARQAYDHAKKFWDCRKSLVEWAFGEGKAPISSESLSLQYQEFGRKTMGEAYKAWERDADRHCLRSSDCLEARWKRFRAALDADLFSFGDRQAEARAQSLNDRRYARQLAALGLGKGIMTNVASFSQIHGDTGLSAGALLGGAINTGMTAVGYHMNRERISRWDGGPEVQRAPMGLEREVPKGYEVEVGRVEPDSPIKTCVKPTEEEQRRDPKAYGEYLRCMGLVK